jgi:hypothetical protein
MEKLPEDFKQKWIAALRSGEYKQGQNALERKGEYCCLGVACAVSGVKDISFLSNYGYIDYDPTGKPELLKVPDLLRGENPVTKVLANMNDGRDETGTDDSKRKSFSEIADYIEVNL